MNMMKKQIVSSIIDRRVDKYAGERRPNKKTKIPRLQSITSKCCTLNIYLLDIGGKTSKSSIAKKNIEMIFFFLPNEMFSV